jgi:intein/homing endonuclease
MGYLHIPLLYKSQEILMFRRAYSLEKVHGCLKKGTKVLLEGGKEKNIEEVVPGDKVVAVQNEGLGPTVFTTAEVESKLVQEADPRLGWIEVCLENGRKIICTEDHPFLTKRGWVEASKLSVEDELIAPSEK